MSASAVQRIVGLIVQLVGRAACIGVRQADAFEMQRAAVAQNQDAVMLDAHDGALGDFHVPGARRRAAASALPQANEELLQTAPAEIHRSPPPTPAPFCTSSGDGRLTGPHDNGSRLTPLGGTAQSGTKKSGIRAWVGSTR